MLNRQEVCDLLKKQGVWFEVQEHAAVYNMAEMAQIPVPYPEAEAKNLFVRDDKKQHFYLITVKAEKRVDLKQLRRSQQTRQLSLAPPEELLRVLGLTPGSVTPASLLDGHAQDVELFLDEELLKGRGLIGIHPNDNTATVWMKTADLKRLVEAAGNSVRVVPL